MIHCIDFNLKPRVTLEWFASDIAFFHSVLLTTAAVDDFIHRRLPSRRTRLHLQRTLSLLNGRLSEADPHMVESTFFIVLNLAFVASMLGDREAVSAHMDGLWRIIRLRGAVHPRNNVKILHLDLWRALMTDGKPGWYRSPVSWRPLYQAPPRKSRTGINSLVEELDVPRLTGVFYDLQALSNSINDASEGGAHLDGAAYDSSVRSIQDRLLHLENDISSPLAHAVRLGMLAFMTTMMRIPGGKIPLTYMYGKLRSTCLGLDVSTPERRCIGFWLLMVGGVSVFEADEPWLRARWEDVAEADLGWDEARSKLREVMWISTLHDDLGRRVFAQVARQ